MLRDETNFLEMQKRGIMAGVRRFGWRDLVVFGSPDCSNRMNVTVVPAPMSLGHPSSKDSPGSSCASRTS